MGTEQLLSIPPASICPQSAVTGQQMPSVNTILKNTCQQVYKIHPLLHKMFVYCCVFPLDALCIFVYYVLYKEDNNESTEHSDQGLK